MSEYNTLSVLNNIESGIGLDISKRHTGIVIWNKNIGYTQEFGFALKDYDLNDKNSHAELDMRTEFKNKLLPIVEGLHFEFGVVEDVYGGVNYDTMRKLLALNTVIDELIQEGICSIDKFFRVKEPTWRSGLRILSTPSMRGLKAKIEVQEALYNLDYSFYSIHREDSATTKKDIFFEDVCDACGMLLGIIAQEYYGDKKTEVKIPKFNVKYVLEQDLEKTIKKTKKQSKVVELNTKKLEISIKEILAQDTNICYYAKITSDKLGGFGLKHKLIFYPNTEICYLVFWCKGF